MIFISISDRTEFNRTILIEPNRILQLFLKFLTKFDSVRLKKREEAKEVLGFHCIYLQHMLKYIYMHEAIWRHLEHESPSLVSEEEMIRMRNFVT